MSNFSDLKTKTKQLAFIKDKLATDDRWLLRGLLTIYKNQTEDEQRTEATKEHNGVGFTGCDAPLLTSYAHQIIRKGAIKVLHEPGEIKAERFLSSKQVFHLRRKMGKYAGQLCIEARNKMATNPPSKQQMQQEQLSLH